jgi:hypothetical protein
MIIIFIFVWLALIVNKNWEPVARLLGSKLLKIIYALLLLFSSWAPQHDFQRLLLEFIQPT